MVLRKCPSCHETVGADSIVCPRCGVSFRAAAVRRVLMWLILIAGLAWIVAHYVLKRI